MAPVFIDDSVTHSAEAPSCRSCIGSAQRRREQMCRSNCSCRLDIPSAAFHNRLTGVLNCRPHAVHIAMAGEAPAYLATCSVALGTGTD